MRLKPVDRPLHALCFEGRYSIILWQEEKRRFRIEDLGALYGKTAPWILWLGTLRPGVIIQKVWAMVGQTIEKFGGGAWGIRTPTSCPLD